MKQTRKKHGAAKELPGYDPDVQKNRTQARQIMEKLGYGPDKRLTWH